SPGRPELGHRRWAWPTASSRVDAHATLNPTWPGALPPLAFRNCARLSASGWVVMNPSAMRVATPSALGPKADMKICGGSSGGVDARGRAGDGGRDGKVADLGDGPDHRPHERALALLVVPRMVVVADPETLEPRLRSEACLLDELPR